MALNSIAFLGNLKIRCLPSFFPYLHNNLNFRHGSTTKLSYSFTSLSYQHQHSSLGSLQCLRPRQKFIRSRFHKTLQIVKCCANGGRDVMQEAAEQLVDYFVRSGMVVGLGCGPSSTAAIRYLGNKLRQGKLSAITAVPMSAESAAEAAKAGIPLSSLTETEKIDIAFTDADLIQEGTLYSVIGRKGVPGRDSIAKEKAVLRKTEQLVLLAEEKKFVQTLDGAIPVEISQEGWLDIAEEIDDCFLGDAEVWRRPTFGTAGPLGGDFPLVTHEGNFVVDILFTSKITDPAEVGQLLETVEGIVEHGLLLDGVYGAAIGSKDGVKLRTSLFKDAFISTE